MLKDKVVLVTGAGNGIGAEIAKLAAKQGARVVVNDLGTSQFGAGADTSPAQKVADETLKAYGRLDVVVNNAGVLRDNMFHKMTDEDWQLVLGVTLSGYFYVSRAAANLF